MNDLVNWSPEGASREGAEAVEPSRASRRGMLLAALRRGPITNAEACEIGGIEGTRRLRELRQMGHPVSKPERVPGTTLFIYRLTE